MSKWNSRECSYPIENIFIALILEGLTLFEAFVVADRAFREAESATLLLSKISPSFSVASASSFDSNVTLGSFFALPKGNTS